MTEHLQVWQGGFVVVVELVTVAAEEAVSAEVATVAVAKAEVVWAGDPTVALEVGGKVQGLHSTGRQVVTAV